MSICVISRYVAQQSWSSRKCMGRNWNGLWSSQSLCPGGALTYSQEECQELNWCKACTLNITKINASVVEHEWSLLLVFVQSCTLRVGLPLCAFVPPWHFFPQEHVVTCNPEQLHLYSPFFFQGTETQSLWRHWKGRCWEMCLSWLVWKGIPWVGALGRWAHWWEGSFPGCSPKLLVLDKLRVYLMKLHPMNMVCIYPTSLLRLKKK